MTTAGEAKKRIAALLQAWPALTGVDVQLSGPIDSETVAPEMIFLGSVRGDQRWAALGKLSRHETYTIDLFIRIWRAKTAATEAVTEDRCWQILSDTETALRSDPALTGLLEGNMQLGTLVQSTVPTLEPVGWRSGVDCQIRVETHLRLP